MTGASRSSIAKTELGELLQLQKMAGGPGARCAALWFVLHFGKYEGAGAMTQAFDDAKQIERFLQGGDLPPAVESLLDKVRDLSDFWEAGDRGVKYSPRQQGWGDWISGLGARIEAVVNALDQRPEGT